MHHHAAYPRSFAHALHGKRSTNLDLLRLGLATLVLFSHAFQVTQGMLQREPFVWLLRGASDGGAIAVDGFFVLSGLLILHSWARTPAPLLFVAKRLLRLYPAYLAMTAACLLIIVPLGLHGQVVYPDTQHLGSWLLDIAAFEFFAVPGLFAHNPYPHVLNGSLWTLKYEALCYLLVPLLGLVGFYRNRRAMLSLWLVALVLHAGQLAHTITVFEGVALWFPRFGCAFLTGMTFYLYRDRIPYDRRLVLLALAAGALTSLYPVAFRTLLPVWLSYPLCYAAFHRRIVAPWLHHVGDLSYGVYIYAFPIQQLIVYAAGFSLEPYVLFALGLPFILFAALLSWHLVERPSLALAPRRTAGERAKIGCA